MVKVPKSMLLRACIYPSPDINGFFVAHCLELDLIGEGKTPKKAILELIRAIELQIEACDNMSQLSFLAPASVWQRFKQAHNSGRVILTHIVKEALQQATAFAYIPTFQDVVATSAVPQQYVQVNTMQ